jgi:hypothetical protein
MKMKWMEQKLITFFDVRRNSKFCSLIVFLLEKSLAHASE